jgi:hypothetical protein
MSRETFTDPDGVTFTLEDPIDHPFYEWPRTLLSYDVEFAVDGLTPGDLRLVREETGEAVPVQLSAVETDHDGGLSAATVNFFADLPAGEQRRFVLERGSDGDTPDPPEPVAVHRDGEGTVLDGGSVRVRLPESDDPRETGAVPGPIRGLDRGEGWVGTSRVRSPDRRVETIEVTEREAGPLFATYQVDYRFDGGGRYTVTVRSLSGLEFVEVDEEMVGLDETDDVVLSWDWSDFAPTHRQAPDFPTDSARTDRSGFDRYDWQAIDDRPVVTNNGIRDGIDPDTGELTFRLGAYEPWGPSEVLPCATFWDEGTDDAVGVFLTSIDEWQDGEYAVWQSSDTLQGRYVYRDGRLTWEWPLVEGSRSTGLAHYDHDRDVAAMDELEAAYQAAEGGEIGEFDYPLGLMPRTNTTRLRDQYGARHLDRVKDWTLEYPDDGAAPPDCFEDGALQDPEQLVEDVFTYPDVVEYPWHSRSIGPPPARIWYEEWVDGLARLSEDLPPERRRRLVGLCLLLGYFHAGEEVMPLRTMLAGHPNFLADIKSVPGYLPALFPDHPEADTWADTFGAFVRTNARYHTRPDVEAYNAVGGRWTENIGCYLWVGLRSVLPASYLLREHYDGRNPVADPNMADLAEYLVGALTAPFDGEAPGEADRLIDVGHHPKHTWGMIGHDDGPRRAILPQGAHSVRGTTPREMWLLAQFLGRYRPLAAEHLAWVTEHDDDRSGTDPDSDRDPWRVAVDHYLEADAVPDTTGTNPHLETEKYTGYGMVFRAGVDTDREVSVHLQQIDEGPNYRWGKAGMGGCGVIYYAADGQIWSDNGKEDVGDRSHHDTDYCCNFGVWTDGAFRSIGRNVLEEPMYSLETADFGRITAREETAAWPEYQSRSVLLAGTDYLVTYDDVFHDSVDHRFSWFVQRQDDLPAIYLPNGGGRRTTVETEEVHGVHHDGEGDCLAVVSHRDDLAVEPTDYGCRVERPAGLDRVFRDGSRIDCSGEAYAFTGRAGLIREQADGTTEVALFDGSAIAADGVTLAVPEAAPVAVECRVTDAAALRGTATNRGDEPARVRIETDDRQGESLYLDGEHVPDATNPDGSVAVPVPPGDHRWELLDGEPTPPQPTVDHTETGATRAVVHFGAVAGADGYRVEVSHDAGRSWESVGATDAPPYTLTGLDAGSKVHVRVVATNADRESQPAEEYPLYPDEEPPAPPDGLRVRVDDGVRLSWGTVLGVSGYTLYRRERDGDGGWTPVYEGPETEYDDGEVSAPDGADADVYEYAVSATDLTGEGERSRPVDTEDGWDTWEPNPGEPFRRRVPYSLGTRDVGQVGDADVPEHYPE